MSEIFNPNYNDLPTQVEINKRDIANLKKYLQDVYYSTQIYSTIEIPGTIRAFTLSNTDVPFDTSDSDSEQPKGWIVSGGFLYNILRVEFNPEVQSENARENYVVVCKAICKIKGDDGAPGSVGPTGPTGPAGPPGQAGEQVYTANYLDNATELGDTIHLALSSTDIPSDTELGEINGLLLTGSSHVFNNLEIVLDNNEKYVDGDFLCNMRGEPGPEGIYTSIQETQGQPGNYQYLDMSLTDIPIDTPVGNLYGMIITASGDIWYELQIVMNNNVKTVYAGYFTNIKGQDGQNGQDGLTPDITMSASVNNSTGTPSVSVTKTGTTTNPIFSLAFENLKGETGEKGDDAVSLSIGTVTEGTPADASLTSDGNGNYTLDLTIPSGGGDPSYTLAKAGSNMQPTLGNLPNVSIDPNYRALYGFYHDDFKHKELDRLINTKSNGIIGFALENLWSDGVYLYYFDYYNDSGTYIYFYYYFNESTQTWVDITSYTPRNEFDGEMNTLDSFYIRGKCIYAVSGKWVVNDYDWYLPSSNPELESGPYIIEPDCICSGDSSCFNIYKASLSFDSGVWGLSNNSITKTNLFNFNGKTYYIGAPEGSYFQYQLFIDGSGDYQTLHVATIPTPLFNNTQVLLNQMAKFDDSLYYNVNTSGLYKCANNLTLTPSHVNVWFMDNESYDWSSINYVSFNHAFSVKGRKYTVVSLYVYDDFEQTYAEVYNGLCYFYDDNNGNVYLTPAIIYMPNYDIGIDDADYQYYYKIGESNGYGIPLNHLCLDDNIYLTSPVQAYDSTNDFYFWSIIKIDNRVR